MFSHCVFRKLSTSLSKAIQPRLTLTMDAISINHRHLSSLPYTSCNTRIVSLQDLDLPEQASDDDYRRIYEEYTARTDPNAALLRDAIESIKHGLAPPVAFPTETVYGLGADATNEPAISGIFAAKGRPSDNPLIVHVSSVAHLERLTGEPLPEIYRSLTQNFWPGPLTILLGIPKNSVFAKNVHPAQSTIGFRIPSSKYARFFIAATDRPIAGPSANSSGKPSPTTARHVLDDLRGKVNFILDGGTCDVGVESTVVDGLHDPPLILRPGGVSQSELVAHGKTVGNAFANTAIGYKRHHDTTSPASTSSSSPSVDTLSSPAHPSYDEDANGAPRAPGMKYRHYSPEGRLLLFSERAVSKGKVQSTLDEIIRQSSPSPGEDGANVLKVGIISCHWPAFAGLPVSLAATNGANPPLENSVYAPITSIATYTGLDSGSNTKTLVTLYNVHVGTKITSLAHSLFGILRLFDDLGCSVIFAETVKRSSSGSASDLKSSTGSDIHQEQVGDIEDAVIDRIEKAAAERVD
ncbi:Sua5/YciO/YrdC/YwlC family tRNA threonylcarbamoyl adenosine modification protein [Exophiala sideris]|uniref:Threonylcarbamoyl-AMP synthase n=1 Tax=Exophiala sideris TaxID=1016849 RepID=A0A0D1YK37_9EURO|nr:Sua5/YciO/YrdC/YwlC family tRNA threonylcarbamoyl adenosine modification protein [Exophiala sideris]